MNRGATTMQLTVGLAAKEVGKAKTTISRAIKSGKLSAKKNEDGSYSIDPAELFRAFPPKAETVKAQPPATASEQAQRREIELLQRLVTEQKERITGLEADKERVWALLENMQGKQPEPDRKGLWGRVFGSVAVLVFVMSFTQPLSAYFTPGNDFVEYSEAQKKGYVEGVIDGFQFATDQRLYDFGWVVSCLASGWTNNQLVAVADRYFETRPEKRNVATVYALHDALEEACQ